MVGRPGALLLAVGLDLVAGEPPDRWHPVAWVGRGLAALDRGAGPRTVANGGKAVVAVLAVVSVLAALTAALARRLPRALGVVVEALALEPAFAVRRLGTAAAAVEAALGAGDLAGARRLAGRDLVSRDTGELTPPEMASATVESVAENLGDSVVAPLLAYAAGGLPAAWAYRVVNTADAMWGYRDRRYERFGKVAARLDDAANWLPSRLAALAIVAGAAAAGEAPAGAFRIARRDHRRTASPNAGWPMAAMAGALGVSLAKRGVYRLGDGALPASSAVIRRSRRVYAGAAAVTAVAALALVTWVNRPPRAGPVAHPPGCR